MHKSIPHKFQHAISHARLLEVLRYDPGSGDFYWRVRRNSHAGCVRPGDKVEGTLNVHGYRIIGIDRQRYAASRLAWFYIHGKWPEGEVDHINRNILDNRIENLRVAAHRSLQRANQAVRKDSKSGIKGVDWLPRRQMWRARCNGKTLGYFLSAEEAHAAYVRAAVAEFGGYARSK